MKEGNHGKDLLKRKPVQDLVNGNPLKRGKDLLKRKPVKDLVNRNPLKRGRPHDFEKVGSAPSEALEFLKNLP